MTYRQDNWIEDNLPRNVSPEMRVTLEIIMRLAYNEGIKEGQEISRSQAAADERERLYGPDI